MVFDPFPRGALATPPWELPDDPNEEPNDYLGDLIDCAYDLLQDERIEQERQGSEEQEE